MQHTEKELKAAREYAAPFYDTLVKHTPGVDLAVEYERNLRNAHLAGQTYAKENAWIRVDSGELPPGSDKEPAISIPVVVSHNGRTYIARWGLGTKCFYDGNTYIYPNETTQWTYCPAPPKD